MTAGDDAGGESEGTKTGEKKGRTAERGALTFGDALSSSLRQAGRMSYAGLAQRATHLAAATMDPAKFSTTD